MFNKKELQIVQLLIQHKGHYLTSKEIANALSCSDRTIRNHYRSLSEKMADYPGIELQAKQGLGYQLKINDEGDFHSFLKEHHLNDWLPHHQVYDKEDRYNFILNKLLFEQDEIYFDDLADELFVSRSTLSADFRAIRKQLEPFQLQIESKSNKGVYITGDERDKRRFILDYFVHSGLINILHHYVDNEMLSKKISFEELTVIVIDECREAQLKLSDFIIQNLVIHIALAISRITEGFQITKIDDAVISDDSIERDVAERILTRVKAVTEIDIPIEEIDYITIHLISKNLNRSQYVPEGIYQQMKKELVRNIEQHAPMLKDDLQLVEGLLTHLSTVLIRLNNHIHLENPLAEDIKNHYVDSYQLAEKVIRDLMILNNYTLTTDEISYVALHFMAALERHKNEKKYNILVICATGFGSAQMLKSRIENELGTLVNIVDVIGYFEISDQKLENIDFIISSIDLSNLIFSIPTFTVSVFLTDQEIGTIRNGISRLSASHLPLEDEEETIDLEEIFDDYFSEKAFTIVQSAKKSDIMDNMIHQISEGENDFFEERMVEMISQREAMSTVVFSDTIAVPHPIKAVGNHHRIAVTIVKDGCHWSNTFPAIKIIFLTSMSTFSNEGLSHLTANIVDLVDLKDKQEEILNCRDFKEFKQIFLKIRERK